MQSVSLHPLEINPCCKDMWSQWSRETLNILSTQRNSCPGAVIATIFPSIYLFLCSQTCIIVYFSLYKVTPFSESWKCGTGCVLGMSRVGEHDMLIKEWTCWPGPLRQRKIETLCTECQHRWEKWRQKRKRTNRGVSEEKGRSFSGITF